MLTEAFGNKWKKSALEKSKRNKIDEQTMKDHLAADIDHGREQAKFHEQNAGLCDIVVITVILCANFILT